MEVNVPTYFLCPISLEIMRDPVTLSTGITYDRPSIQHWLRLHSSSSAATSTCPVTRQPLLDTHLTPNSTLRRLIESWCTANPTATEIARDHRRSRIPHMDESAVVRLLDDLRRAHGETDSLRKLRDVIADGEEGRRMAEEAGAAYALVDLIKNSTTTGVDVDDSIAALHSLRLTEDGLFDLYARDPDVVETLTVVMRVSRCETRERAISMVRSLLRAVSPVRMVAVKGELFAEVVRVVGDRISGSATKAALQVLAELVPWGRNRVKAAVAGAVEAIVETLLAEGPERRKRVWELGLVTMEMVCGCAEGRQALVGHAAGISVVSKALLGLSRLATEKASRILCAVAKHAGRPEVVREMAEMGVVSKLCMVMHVDESLGGGGGGRTREKVVQVLRLHYTAWGNSPCVERRLLGSSLSYFHNS